MTASTISSYSGDGELIKQVIRRGLIILSFAIVLLAGTSLWTSAQLTNFYHDEVNIVSEQEHLLQTMRLTSRERTLLLYDMATESDPFVRDEHRMDFYSKGAKFAQARIEFSQLPLKPTESLVLEEQGKATGITVPAQNEVIDLLTKGDDKSALKYLHENAIPGQRNVMRTLDKLHVLIDQRNDEIKSKAEIIGKTGFIIQFSLTIIIILGAVYIFRQTTFRASGLIFQLTKTRELLQDTNNELRQQKETVDHHAIVSIADKQGKIIYVNDKFCEVSGFTKNELLGKNHRILKSNVHSQEFYKELWNTISSGCVWKGEICNKRKDGSVYWVESTINPFLDENGKPYQYVSVRTDITHLLDAKFKAEEASRAKSIFLSSMSHELRTPMNAILGFTQILLLDARDEAVKDSYTEILNAANHLLELINEILDLSKIESGKISLNVADCNLKEITEFCISLVKPDSDKKSIVIENKIDVLPDVTIFVDEKRFKQVLLNLISNAIKYNKENGQVTIEYFLTDEKLHCISVTDTGKGIATEQVNNIFKPFDRAGNEGTSITGTGLGLMIAKKLIEIMGGSIGFESAEGKGSRFWIEFP